MKICITANGPTLDSFIDSRFGRCQYLLFIEADKKKKPKLIKKIANQSIMGRGGVGITTAQQVVNEKAAAIITGNIGPNAFNVLQLSKIKIYQGVFNLTIEQAIEKFQQGKLEETKQETVAGHFGIGGRFGGGSSHRGMGRGRWN